MESRRGRGRVIEVLRGHRAAEGKRGREGSNCEAVRRKSTAHQGGIRMMEGSQLRQRDRRMETETEEGWRETGWSVFFFARNDDMLS